MSFLSVVPVFTFLLSDLGLFTRYSGLLMPAPTWIVFIGLWLFASYPDLSPGVQLCLCLACTVWLFSIKLQMDPNFWLFVTEDFAKQSSSSAHATINRAICTSFTTPLAPTPVKSNHHPDRGAGQSTARAKCIITRNCISSSTSPQ